MELREVMALAERLEDAAANKYDFANLDSHVEACTDAAAYLRAHGAGMQGWRPIETAPKDGTRVMLCNSNGVWLADWRPVYGSGYRPECPWSSAMLNHDHMDVHRYGYCPPTHWQPLPAAPQENSDG